MFDRSTPKNASPRKWARGDYKHYRRARAAYQAAQHFKLSGSECSVLVYLCHRAPRKKAGAYAATKTIAEQTRLGRSSIIRALKTLQDLGLIFAVERAHRRPTTFQLLDCFYEKARGGDEDDDYEDDDAA